MTNQLLNTTGESFSKAITEKNTPVHKNWTLLHLAARVGLLGGTFLLFAAIFLTAVEYFLSEKQVGDWLYAAVLPLWIIGAMCLDKIEDAEKAERIENCKKSGMKDKDCANL